MKIVITAGHSNTDPGAVAGGQTEAKLMTQLRNLVAEHLRALGHVVLTDGEGEVNQSLNDALAIIKKASPDIALELHMNAATSTTATGVETIALPGDKALAQRISAAVGETLGLRLRGDKGWIDQSQSARGRLGYINAGGLILEVAFISNPGDLAAVQGRMGEVAAAISQALNTEA